MIRRTAILAAALALAAPAAAQASDLGVIRAVDRGATAIDHAFDDVESCMDLAVYTWECAGATSDRSLAYGRALDRLERAKRGGAPEPCTTRLYNASVRYWTTGRAISVALEVGNLGKAQRLLPVNLRQGKLQVRTYGAALRCMRAAS